jgi:Ni/Co efflux regulator RcnB
MKPISLIAATVAASLGLSSVSYAQGWRDRDDHPGQRAHERREQRFENRQERREQRFEHRQDRREQRFEHRQDRRDDRWEARSDWQRRHHAAPQYVQPAQPVYRHAWRTAPYYAPQVHYVNAAPRYYYRGDVLPWEYRRNMVVVNDWNTYGLYAPPYGHQWVRSDTGEILLIALATGLIANLLLR